VEIGFGAVSKLPTMQGRELRMTMMNVITEEITQFLEDKVCSWHYLLDKMTVRFMTSGIQS
jgi:hypothetical protein